MATIYGNAKGNQLKGTAADDRIVGRGGDDRIFGEGGIDFLFGGDGDDTLYLGKLGVSALTFGSYVNGDAGVDRAVLYLQNYTQDLTISSQYTRVIADMGDGTTRTVTSLVGIEKITAYLGSGDDHFAANPMGGEVFSGAGDDRLVGLGGRDFLYGQSGDDVIYGNPGDDLLSGGEGDDRIFGGNERDTIIGDSGVDRLYGEFGDDVIYGGNDNDLVSGGGGRDAISGDGGDDTLYGDGDADRIDGGQGRDKLYGGDGNDLLSGGLDVDRLYGGSGADRLSGGEGHDRFIWLSPAEGGDTVLDFQQGQDILLFDGAGFGGIASVDSTNFVSNSAGVAKDAADRFVFSQNTGGLFFDPDGNGAAAKILIAHIDFAVGTELAATDIRIG